MSGQPPPLQQQSPPEPCTNTTTTTSTTEQSNTTPQRLSVTEPQISPSRSTLAPTESPRGREAGVRRPIDSGDPCIDRLQQEQQQQQQGTRRSSGTYRYEPSLQPYTAPDTLQDVRHGRTHGSRFMDHPGYSSLTNDPDLDPHFEDSVYQEKLLQEHSAKYLEERMAYMDTQNARKNQSPWLQYHLGQTQGHPDHQRSLLSSGGSPHGRKKNVPDGLQHRSMRPVLFKSISNLELGKYSRHASSTTTNRKHTRHVSENGISPGNLWWITKGNKDEHGNGNFTLTPTKPQEYSQPLGSGKVQEVEQDHGNRNQDSQRLRSARQRLLGTTRSQHGGLLPMRKTSASSFKEMRFFDTAAMVSPASMADHKSPKATGGPRLSGHPRHIGANVRSKAHTQTPGDKENVLPSKCQGEGVAKDKAPSDKAVTSDPGVSKPDVEGHSRLNGEVSDPQEDANKSDHPTQNPSINGDHSPGEGEGSPSSSTSTQSEILASQTRLKQAKLANLTLSNYFYVNVDETSGETTTALQESSAGGEAPGITATCEGLGGVTSSEDSSDTSSNLSPSNSKRPKRTVRFSVKNEVLEYEPWQPIGPEEQST